MGYLDGIVDGSFKTTSEGINLFYPYGILGQGYVIPSAEKKQQIQTKLKRLIFISFAIIFISMWGIYQSIKILTIPLWVAGLVYLAIGMILTLVGVVLSGKLAKGLMPVGEKLTVAESYQNSAKSHNIFTLVSLEIASILFVVTGAWIIFANHFVWYFKLSSVLGVLFFGFCGVAIGYMIKAKISK